MSKSASASSSLCCASAFQNSTAAGGSASIDSSSCSTAKAGSLSSGGGSASTGTPAASSAWRPGVGWLGCSCSTAARGKSPACFKPSSSRRALVCAPPVLKLLATSSTPPRGLRPAARATPFSTRAWPSAMRSREKCRSIVMRPDSGAARATSRSAAAERGGLRVLRDQRERARDPGDLGRAADGGGDHGPP